MGVGNLRFTPRGTLPWAYTNVRVSQLAEQYDAYLARAFESFKEWVKENHKLAHGMGENFDATSADDWAASCHAFFSENWSFNDLLNAPYYAQSTIDEFAENMDFQNLYGAGAQERYYESSYDDINAERCEEISAHIEVEDFKPNYNLRDRYDRKEFLGGHEVGEILAIGKYNYVAKTSWECDDVFSILPISKFFDECENYEDNLPNFPGLADQFQDEWECSIKDAVAKQTFEHDQLRISLLRALDSVGDKIYEAVGAWTSAKVDTEALTFFEIVELPNAQALNNEMLGDINVHVPVDMGRAIGVLKKTLAAMKSLPPKNAAPLYISHGTLMQYVLPHMFQTETSLLAIVDERHWFHSYSKPGGEDIKLLHISNDDNYFVAKQISTADQVNIPSLIKDALRDGAYVNASDIPPHFKMLSAEEAAEVSEFLGISEESAKAWTGAFVFSADGEYKTVYVTESARPYLKECGYYPIYADGQLAPCCVLRNAAPTNDDSPSP